MFSLMATIEGANEFAGLDYTMRLAVQNKFRELADMLYDKVMTNVSGRLLEVKSGQLHRSIEKEVDVESNPMFALVGPMPESPKAWALEMGGSGFYPIPSEGFGKLAFFWERIGQRVVLQHVNHPPSKAYQYLADAAAEMENIVDEALGEAITEAWLAGD